MHRLSNGTQATSLPVPAAVTGTPGYATQGSPGVTPASDIDPDQWNAMQEELVAIVTAAGIALDKTDNGQVLKALQTLFLSLAGAYAVDTGTANALAIALTPAPASLAALTGVPLRVKKNASVNTGAVTLAVGALAATAVVHPDGTALTAGDLPSGGILSVSFDGTNFVLQSPWGTSLCGVQVFATAGTATYMPTAGTKAVVVEVQGAGGAGGGAAITGAGQVSLGSGGAAGAFAISRLTSGFSGVAITVGAAGVGAAGAAGGNGGTSSFGTLISAPGGLGGSATGAQTPPWATGVSSSIIATGGNITNGPGESGSESIALSASVAFGGQGGQTRYGGGGGIANSNLDGATTYAPGAAGGGAANLASQATARKGGNGGAGLVIVWEYK